MSRKEMREIVSLRDLVGEESTKSLFLSQKLNFLYDV